MNTLTLKSFLFELRGCNIEKFETIDPTDRSNTRVYIQFLQFNIITVL